MKKSNKDKRAVEIKNHEDQKGPKKIKKEPYRKTKQPRTKRAITIKRSHTDQKAI